MNEQIRLKYLNMSDEKLNERLEEIFIPLLFDLGFSVSPPPLDAQGRLVVVPKQEFSPSSNSGQMSAAKDICSLPLDEDWGGHIICLGEDWGGHNVTGVMRVVHWLILDIPSWIGFKIRRIWP